MKKKLTAEQLAAMALGATLEQVLASAGMTADQVDLTPENDEADSAQLAADLAAANEALAAAESALAEATEGLTKLQADFDTLKASNDELTTASTSLTATIQGRVNQMSVAMGMKAPEPTTDAVALAKAHDDLQAAFAKKFPAGGASRPSHLSGKPDTKTVVNQSVADKRFLADAKAIAIV